MFYIPGGRIGCCVLEEHTQEPKGLVKRDFPEEDVFHTPSAWI